MNIKLAELLSNNNGRLPNYLTKAYYPVYYTTIQGLVLCPHCANLILQGETFVGEKRIIADDLDDCKINWDNYNLKCEHGHKIESATIELELPQKIGVYINDKNKRQIPNKIGHIKLHSNGEQASQRH